MAWWERAKAGDKVVCISALSISEQQRATRDGVTVPQVGQVYTIRGSEPVKWFSGVFFWLVEITNPPHHSDGAEPNFHYEIFRPVQTKSTEEGMKMIRKLLDSVPVKEDA